MVEEICIPNGEWIVGGVCAPRGFSASGIHCGIALDENRKDLALVCATHAIPAAGVFTQNVFSAAPVKRSKAHISSGTAQAIIINSANANAATGMVGDEAAEKTAEALAQELGCASTEVLLASTGVIGVHLPVEKITSSLGILTGSLDEHSGSFAAEAIMTTDTHPKECALNISCGGRSFTLGGMAKGSGMISPDMATLIAVLTTDAPLDAAACDLALRRVVNTTFNRVTIDSDTSTNDSCFFMASGEEGGEPIRPDTPLFDEFVCALTTVCENLARQIARDGEGATKLVTVDVSGAKTSEDASRCARAIADSPLVKTAVFGHDANWGRIAMAAGKSGAEFKQEDVSISIMGLNVCRQGLPVAFDESEALRRFKDDEINIAVDLGAGSFSARMWTCDFSYDYVRINGEYRT